MAAEKFSRESPGCISVVGLGKLGAPFAACLAGKGYVVVGVDADETKLELINNGQPPLFEPGLEQLMQLCKGTLRATSDYADAVANSDLTFILLPTPSEGDGSFSLQHVLPACERLGEAIRHKTSFHLFALTSTVMPGSTENEVKPLLERVSGKKCGEGFGLCYNPEFVALGSVIRDLVHPDFVLIGQSDQRSGDLLIALYKNFCDNDPPVARMNFVNAEIAKLALNTFVTTKIAFANMLARICERLPGAEVDTVTSALALDKRIGGRYLTGAIGYGGPCFPRDNLALASLGRRLGSATTLVEATDKSNRQEVQTLAQLVKSKLPPGGTVGILGLAYKANTDVVEKSQGLLLAQLLVAEGIPVAVHDPIAMPNASRVLGESVTLAKSATECIKAAQVVVLATPWDDFKSLAPQSFDGNEGRKALVDCWRLLDPKDFKPVVEYIPLGVGTKRIRGRAR